MSGRSILNQSSVEKTDRRASRLAAMKHRASLFEKKTECIQDKALSGWTFDKAEDTSTIQMAKQYVEHWAEVRENNLGLLLWGDVGTGKSFTAACIANALLETGVPVLMTNFSKILNKTGGLYSEERYKWLFSCIDVDDDVDDVPDESDEPDDDKIAMLLMPGEKPEVMKWAEVCELMPDFDEKSDRMNGFTDAGLVLYYRPDQVITFGDKEYLLGVAAVVCEADDYNIISMDGKEIYEVFQYAEDCTTTLCSNDRDFPALALCE